MFSGYLSRQPNPGDEYTIALARVYLHIPPIHKSINWEPPASSFITTVHWVGEIARELSPSIR